MMAFGSIEKCSDLNYILLVGETGFFEEFNLDVKEEKL